MPHDEIQKYMSIYRRSCSDPVDGWTAVQVKCDSDHNKDWLEARDRVSGSGSNPEVELGHDNEGSGLQTKAVSGQRNRRKVLH